MEKAGVVAEAAEDERSESDEEHDDDDSKCWLEGRQDMVVTVAESRLAREAGVTAYIYVGGSVPLSWPVGKRGLDAFFFGDRGRRRPGVAGRGRCRTRMARG